MTSGEFLPQQVRLSDVNSIAGGVAIPSTRETLEYLVEAPLLAACQEFYDKNIRTITSSANHQDVLRGFAFINIDCNTLSKKNRQIAEDLGMHTFNATERDGSTQEVGSFLFPVTSETSAVELSDTALALAQKFEVQPMLWANPLDLDSLRKQNPGMDDALIVIQLAQRGFYFDPVAQKAYHSREHYFKVKSFPVK